MVMNVVGPLRGILPIVPTIFDERGEVDDGGMRATVDFLLRAGVYGMVTLANASEGYSVTDAERHVVIGSVIAQVNGRVPIVASCNHPSTIVAIQYAREAQDLGAAALMFLPPFFGQWAADLNGIHRHFDEISKHTTIPLILQDHPLSGIALPSYFLVDLARQIDRLEYFKVEAQRAPTKIGEMVQLSSGQIKGLFGGMGGVSFLEELDHGAVGTMPSSSIPEVFVHILSLYQRGDREASVELFNRYLPLINFEAHVGGYRVAKEVLAACGIIRSAFIRGPIRSAWDDVTTRSFRGIVAKLDLLALAKRS